MASHDLTKPSPAEHQQMDRSNDPETTRKMDAAAPKAALASRRQRMTGEATGVGSVGYDEDGAFDVGAGKAEILGADGAEISGDESEVVEISSSTRVFSRDKMGDW